MDADIVSQYILTFNGSVSNIVHQIAKLPMDIIYISQGRALVETSEFQSFFELRKIDGLQLSVLFQTAKEPNDWDFEQTIMTTDFHAALQQWGTLQTALVPSEAGASSEPVQTFSIKSKFVRQYANQKAFVRGLVTDKMSEYLCYEEKGGDLCVRVTLTNETWRIGFEFAQFQTGLTFHSRLWKSIFPRMINLADIQPGDIVLDPCCGQCRLLSMAYRREPCAVYIGTEKLDAQVDTANHKLKKFGYQKGYQRIDLLHGDSTFPFIQPHSVDVILVDLPFGKEHGTVASNEGLYADLFSEFQRVLRVNTGRLVCITSTENEATLGACLDTWSVIHQEYYRAGNMNVILSHANKMLL